jgi:hypothetical protein
VFENKINEISMKFELVKKCFSLKKIESVFVGGREFSCSVGVALGTER